MYFSKISGEKKEGALCGDAENNCEGGLTCVWDGQDNGVGICQSTQGICNATKHLLCWI